MNAAWLIFMAFAYFGFEDPLKKQKKKWVPLCAPCIRLFHTHSYSRFTQLLLSQWSQISARLFCLVH